MPTTRRTVAKKATRKAATRVSRPRVVEDTVKVARFGSTPTTVKVNRGSAVRDVLEKAGISLGSAEKVYINSHKVAPSSVVYNGDILSVISPKAAGKNALTR